jgi:cobalt-zinc-cadmium efflux system membrane fusion protein
MTARTVLGLLCLLAVCTACSRGGPDDARAAKPEPPPAAAAAPDVAVVVASPQYQQRATTLETSGKAQFNEEALARVHAPGTGRVLDVLARPGETVEPGHRLLVIDSPDLGTAKSDYAKAVADVERADAALQLARELFEIKAVPQKDVREADNDYRKSVAERDRAAARLRTLGVGPEQLPAIASRADAGTQIIVLAPRAGVIVERNVSPGQVVAYGQSDTPVNLFVIADVSTMWVLADVYEPDVSRVRRGQRVAVTLPCCPDGRFEGAVDYISDVVDKDTRTVKVRAVVPNRGRTLKAEMFVKVSIATGTSRLLTLPQSAIHRESGQTYVLVQEGKDQYARRRVRLGAESAGVVEVVDGVTPVDRVVASGSILLKKAAH